VDARDLLALHVAVRHRHDCSVGDEIELAAKSAGEIAGAVADVLAQETRALAPLRERMDALTARIHYRYYPQTIRQALRAAQRIEEAGLPRKAIEAIPDPLLRAILEGGAMAPDETMHERWANLLANALTDGPTTVMTAFPRILADLEPIEAALLDQLSDGKLSVEGEVVDEEADGDEKYEVPPWFRWAELSFERCVELGVTRLAVYNLRRLNLVWAASDIMSSNVPNEVGLALFPGSDPNDLSQPLILTITELGFALVQACRPPMPHD
jgi:hypothetical protein